MVRTSKRRLTPRVLERIRRHYRSAEAWETEHGGLTYWVDPKRGSILLRDWVKLHDLHMDVIYHAAHLIETGAAEEARKLLDKHVRRWDRDP